MTYSRRIAIAAAALIGAPAWAQPFEDVAALDSRLAAALGAAVGEPGGAAAPIDRRLRLAACPVPTLIEAPALGAATLRCEPLGWRIRVPLARRAAPDQAAAARAEPVVRKGDQVELVASGASFSVSTLAVAEQDGAVGDRIRVRPERKSGLVIGIVGEDGRVSLPGFK